MMTLTGAFHDDDGCPVAQAAHSPMENYDCVTLGRQFGLRL